MFLFLLLVSILYKANKRVQVCAALESQESFVEAFGGVVGLMTKYLMEDDNLTLIHSSSL